MQEQKYMPSAMAANTKPEPDICMCKAWGKALTPPNGESGKGVIEGRRAADAFEKRAHIPTVCRRSLPGNHSAQTVRGGLSPRMPKAKPSEHRVRQPPRAVSPSPRRQSHWHINGQSARTHAPPPPRAGPGSGPRSAGSRRYLIPVIRDVRADGKVDEYVRGSR